MPASSSGNDFNDAETAFWAFVDSIGVRNDRLKALIERLETDFRAADGGYATLEVPAEDGSWRAVRGGSYLDHAWGVRAARDLAADPARATPTTGFRLVIDPGSRP